MKGKVTWNYKPEVILFQNNTIKVIESFYLYENTVFSNIYLEQK